MYTQCPDCATVFRVSADALRSAQGDVRCGVCSTNFNALENLSEEPFQPAPASEEPTTPSDTMTVEELPGTEFIELSADAESVAASEDAVDSESPGATPARERSMEFDADAGELDRVFVELPAVNLGRIAAVAESGEPFPADAIDPGSIAASLSLGGAADSARAAQGDGDVGPADETDLVDEYPATVADELGEFETQKPPRNPFRIPRILIPRELREGLAEEAAASAAAEQAFVEPEPPASAERWHWAIGAAALAIALAAQVVHSKRDDLLRQPAIGPLVARTYALFGLPLAAPMDLAAYEIRQWGAATDAAQPGRLLLRASIVNRAAYAQPYPLLRLALQDRFGTNIGMRDIEPSDYLRGAVAARLLAPGQRADAEIRIVDPGKDAVGFEMDVCLPSAGGVRCANETSPAAP